MKLTLENNITITLTKEQLDDIEKQKYNDFVFQISISSQEEPKQIEDEQDTLEEAYLNQLLAKDLSIKYAKWQQERMYSKEEVIELLQKYRLDLSSGKTPNLGDTAKNWLEQVSNLKKN